MSALICKSACCMHVMHQNTNVNSTNYVEALRTLMHIYIPCKLLQYHSGKWKLGMDNVWSHFVRNVMDILVKKGNEIIPHRAYSSDLPLSDFFLCPELKKPLRSELFADQAAVINTAQGQFHKLLLQISNI